MTAALNTASGDCHIASDIVFIFWCRSAVKNLFYSARDACHTASRNSMKSGCLLRFMIVSTLG